MTTPSPLMKLLELDKVTVFFPFVQFAVIPAANGAKLGFPALAPYAVMSA
jgi:hypothetical protein